MSPIVKEKCFTYNRGKCFPIERRNLPIQKGRNWREKTFLLGRGKKFPRGEETFPPFLRNRSGHLAANVDMIVLSLARTLGSQPLTRLSADKINHTEKV